MPTPVPGAGSSESAGDDAASGEKPLRTGKCCGPGGRFWQQEMASSNIPLWIYGWKGQAKCSSCLAVFSLLLGAICLNMASSVKEVSISYDHSNVCDEKSPKGCHIHFNVPEDIGGSGNPAYMYYEIPEVFVNHKTYVESKEQAIFGSVWMKYKCDNAEKTDIVKNKRRPNDPAFHALIDMPNDERFSPCGFSSLAMFTDRYKLYDGDIRKSGAEYSEVELDESSVALTSDSTIIRDRVVKATTQESKGKNTLEVVDKKKDEIHRSWLLDDDDERYPFFMQHFLVWMRSPASPYVRNLWAKIDNGLPAGDYTLLITHNSPIWTQQWLAPEKRVLFSSTTSLGGSSQFLGIVYILIGIYCVASTVFFLVSTKFFPHREIAKKRTSRDGLAQASK